MSKCPNKKSYDSGLKPLKSDSQGTSNALLPFNEISVGLSMTLILELSLNMLIELTSVEFLLNKSWFPRTIYTWHFFARA